MSNIIYKKEYNAICKRKITVAYCGKCFSKLSLLGLLDKQKRVQFYCKKCKQLIKDYVFN